MGTPAPRVVHEKDIPADVLAKLHAPDSPKPTKPTLPSPDDLAAETDGKAPLTSDDRIDTMPEMDAPAHEWTPTAEVAPEHARNQSIAGMYPALKGLGGHMAVMLGPLLNRGNAPIDQPGDQHSAMNLDQTTQGRGIDAPKAPGTAYTRTRNLEQDRLDNVRPSDRGQAVLGDILGGLVPTLAAGILGRAPQAVRVAEALQFAKNPSAISRIAQAAIKAAPQSAAVGAVEGAGNSRAADRNDTVSPDELALATAQGTAQGVAGGAGMAGTMEALLGTTLRAGGNTAWNRAQDVNVDLDRGLVVGRAAKAGVEPVLGAPGGLQLPEGIQANFDATRANPRMSPTEHAGKGLAKDVVSQISENRGAMGAAIKGEKSSAYAAEPGPVDVGGDLRARFKAFADSLKDEHPVTDPETGEPTGETVLRAKPKREADVRSIGSVASKLPPDYTAQQVDELVKTLRKSADPSKNPALSSTALDTNKRMYDIAREFRDEHFPELAEVSGAAAKEIGAFDENAQAVGLPKGQKRYDTGEHSQGVKAVDAKIRSFLSEGGHQDEAALRKLLVEDPRLVAAVRKTPEWMDAAVVPGDADADVSSDAIKRMGRGKELMGRVENVMDTQSAQAMRRMEARAAPQTTASTTGRLHAFGTMDALLNRAAGLKNLGRPTMVPAAASAEAGHVTQQDIDAVQAMIARLQGETQ